MIIKGTFDLCVLCIGSRVGIRMKTSPVLFYLPYKLLPGTTIRQVEVRQAVGRFERVHQTAPRRRA